MLNRSIGDNQGALQLRENAVLNLVSKVKSHISDGPTAIIVISAITLAVFIWAVFSSSGANSQNSADFSQTELSPPSQIVPDPIAPAAATDVTSHAAPPSGQASINSTVIESNDGETSVIVNGQPIDVPKNGSVSQTYVNPDGGQTTMSVSSQNTSTGTASNYSTTINSTTVNSNSFQHNFQSGGGQ
jgi:hypothetical protein